MNMIDRKMLDGIATQILKADEKYGTKVDPDVTVRSWNKSYPFVEGERELAKLSRSVARRVEVLRNREDEPRAISRLAYLDFQKDILLGKLDADVDPSTA